MIVLVCGGRKYSNYALIWATLDKIHAERGIARIVHGAGGNTDGSAGIWAERRGVAAIDYPARWRDLSRPDAVIRTLPNGTKYNAKAGTDRNQRMLDEEDVALVVAFQGGTGTKDMIARARRTGIEVIVVPDPDHRPVFLRDVK